MAKNTPNDEKKNSPFDSFLIDDPTPNNTNHRITITNEESSTTCISCQQQLRSCSSKILACLHSICLSCLEKVKDTSVGTIYTCPTCQHKSRVDAICENLFATEANESNGLSTHCRNCEEGNIADWYCENCADWLCLQCKNAHARVRLTKDHTVTQKSQNEVRKIRGTTQTDKLLCQVGNHSQPYSSFSRDLLDS